jgi:tripartite-type tricarboxylate transporter receptor subunit TctC
VLGNGQARFDPTQFTWIGSASHEDGICIAAASSGVTSWDDLLHKELIVGTTAPGTTTFMYPMMLRNLFGARFKLVSGYPDGAQIVLGLERGEVQSICQTYSSLKISRPDWIKDGKVHPIVFLGMERHPELPDLKAIGEMTTRPEQAEMLKVVLAPTVAGRPFVAPPNIPPERAGELRAAFAAMVADASFREDAQKMRIEVEPSTAQQIEELVKNIYALSPDLIAQLKTAVGGSAPQ